MGMFTSLYVFLLVVLSALVIITAQYDDGIPVSGGATIEIVVYITSTANFWRELYMLNSVLQEGSQDMVTLIVDSKLAADVNGSGEYLKSSNFKLMVLSDQNSSEYDMRNTVSAASKCEFVWHVQEETVLKPDSLAVIRTNCIDTSQSCLFFVSTRQQFPVHSFEYYVTPVTLFADGMVYFGLGPNGNFLFEILSKTYAQYIGIENGTLMIDRFRDAVSLQFGVSFGASNDANASTAIAFNETFHSLVDSSDAWRISSIYCSQNPVVVGLVGLDYCRIGLFKQFIQEAVSQDIFVAGNVLDAATMALVEKEFVSQNTILGSRGVNSVISLKAYVKLHYDVQEECLVKGKSVTDEESSTEWQAASQLYLLNTVRSPDNAKLMLNFLKCRCLLSKLSIFRVDEMRHDLLDHAVRAWSQLSALLHFVKSNQTYAVILSDGRLFADPSTVNEVLDKAISWGGDMFDIVFLVDRVGTDAASSPASIRHFPLDLQLPLLTNGYVVTREFATSILLRVVLSVVAKASMRYPDHANFLDHAVLEYFHSHNNSRAYLLQMKFSGAEPVREESVPSIEGIDMNIKSGTENAKTDLVVSHSLYNEQSKLVVAHVSGGIGSQLFTVFATLASVQKHYNFDYRYVFDEDTSSEHKTNLLGSLPPHKFCNSSETDEATGMRCGVRSSTNDGEEDPFDKLFTKYSTILRNGKDGAVDDDEDADNPRKSLVGKVSGGRCKVGKSGYKPTDPIRSVNASVVRLTGAFRSFRPFLKYRAHIYELLLSSATNATLQYLQMILGNVNSLAAGKPLVFVSADDWEGNVATGSSYDADGAADDVPTYMPFTYLQSAVAAVHQHYFPVVPYFVFFAKDTVPLRATFGTTPNACFLSFDTMPDYFTLMLMSSLDSAIISHSLFSRWAAFLLESRIEAGERTRATTSSFLHRAVETDGVSSRPIIIAPRSLTEEERVSGINTSGRRDQAQVAMWGCLYPPSWSLI
jgi:hypothetical protein